MKKVHKKSTTIWNLASAQFALVIFIVGCAIFYVFKEYQTAQKAFFLIIIGCILYLIVSYVKNAISYRQTGYQLTEHAVIIYHGGFTSSEYTVPLSKVQHLDIAQTLYSRFFKLYKLNIYTAGDKHAIRFITFEEATKIKNNVLDLLAQEGGNIHE